MAVTNLLYQSHLLTKVLLFIGFGFFYQQNVFAVNSKDIDSLTTILNQKSLTDSLRLEVLEEIAKSKSITPELSLHYIEILSKIANKDDNKLWQYKAALRFGHTYKKLGDLDKALKNYLDAVTYAKQLGDIRREALIYSAIGSLYKVNKEYDRALVFFNKSIPLLKEVGDLKNLGVTFINSAQIHKTNNQFDSALNNYREAETIFDSINYDAGKAYILGNLGGLYSLKEQYQEAIKNLLKATEILDKLGDYYPITVYQLNISDIYFKKKDLISAKHYAHLSLATAIEKGLKQQIRDASLKLSILYEDTESYKKAYTFHKQYVAYRDSINNEETIRKMADLRTEYQVAQKQAEVDFLINKRERQNIIFAALIVVITLLTFLVFLYYRNYKRKQTLNYIITERKEEIEAQRDQLEALNETKEKFLSIVSHDLLGPVNSFKGLSTIMKASIEAKDIKDLQQIHQLFDKSVNNLSTLLTNLLDWSVTQQGAIPYEPEKIVVSDLVNELLSLFSNMAATKNILLQSTIADSTIVWADKNSLKTILRNLLSNAIKFTVSNGNIILSNIRVEDTVGIQVTDTGVGMPQEKIEQLLAQDTFGHSQGTSGEKGVGLGLQLVKEFTENNKGTLSIESEEGKGTTITVYLPTNEAVVIQ